MPEVLGGRTSLGAKKAVFVARSTWNERRELYFQIHDPEITDTALKQIIAAHDGVREWEYQMTHDPMDRGGSMVSDGGNIQAGNAHIGIDAARAYLASAQGLLPGVKVLVKGLADVAPARALLAAQVLECALKAYLTHAGVSQGELKDARRRHNLQVLWEEAVANGLSLSPTPPAWCVKLNSLHDTPYHLRYPLKVNGVVLPGSDPMTSDLDSVIHIVAQSIAGSVGLRHAWEEE